MFQGGGFPVVKTAKEWTQQAEEQHAILPVYIKMQTRSVIIPMIEALRALMVEVEQMKGVGNGNA